MEAKAQVLPDLGWHARINGDYSDRKMRRIVEIGSKAPGILGKIFYGINYPQVILWTREKRLAMKMSTVYLTAREYLIESGLPKELLDVTAKMFGFLGGRPVAEKLRASVRFICVPWHMRAVRAFHLLVDEFKNGKNIASYGCGSGIIELLALLASGNKDARLTLIDVDPANIALTQELLALFRKNGYGCDSRISVMRGDILTHELPPHIDTVASIGLLHNYFPLDTANSLMEKWFADGATKVITDICYDPQNVADSDAAMRINFVHKVLDWKLGAPDGQRFYSREEFCGSLHGMKATVYDHGQNATIAVLPAK